jgi:hypothetical protein
VQEDNNVVQEDNNVVQEDNNVVQEDNNKSDASLAGCAHKHHGLSKPSLAGPDEASVLALPAGTSKERPLRMGRWTS